MICSVSKKYAGTGFLLAGVKKNYTSLKDIEDEKIVLMDDEFMGEKDTISMLRKKGVVVIPVSEKELQVITPDFVKKVVGGNIVLEGIK